MRGGGEVGRGRVQGGYIPLFLEEYIHLVLHSKLLVLFRKHAPELIDIQSRICDAVREVYGEHAF